MVVLIMAVTVVIETLAVFSLTKSGQHVCRSTRIDLRNDRIAHRVDHGDQIRVVLRYEQSRPRGVERHAESISVESYTFDQSARCRRTDVDDDNLTVAI